MAYATLAQVKQYLSIATATTTDDDLLTALISRAQTLIETATGRVFECSANSTRYFDAVRDVEDGVLYLDKDLCSINTVTNGDAVAVASNERVTEPRNDTPYHAIRLLPSAGKSWTYTTDPQNAISISGKWAYSISPPSDIMHATIRLTAWLYRQKDTGMDGDRVLSADGVLVMPANTPNDVMSICKQYQRKDYR
jgi:hypothetical protein